MKTNINHLLLCVFLPLNVVIAKSQATTAKNPDNKISVGIPIKNSIFKIKVATYLEKMSNWTDFSVQDYIDMVRVYNTIADSYPIKGETNKAFTYVFTIMYLKPAAKKLNAGPSKGMQLYSKQYNLCIGDLSLGYANSRFKIDTLK